MTNFLRNFAILWVVILATISGSVRSFAFERSLTARRTAQPKIQQLHLMDVESSEPQNDDDDAFNAPSPQLFSRRAVMGGALSFAAATLLGDQAFAAAAPPAAIGLDKPTQKAIVGIPEGQPFALNAKLSVLPEQRDSWIQQIMALQKSTRQDETQSLQFSVSEDVQTPNTFYLHQQYKDKQAFLDHAASPHAQKYQDFVASSKIFAKNGNPTTYYFSPLEEGPDWGIKSKRSKNPPTTAYCVTVNLYPKPSKRDEFLDVIRANKKGTDTTEKLALQYTFGESSVTPGVFHFHEEYKGKEEGKQGFEAHANSPHFAGWVAFTEKDDPFVKPPEVYFSKILEA